MTKKYVAYFYRPGDRNYGEIGPQLVKEEKFANSKAEVAQRARASIKQLDRQKWRFLGVKDN